MEVTNEVMPTSRERIEEMMQPGPDGPIYMVNLLKFKEHAEYEDGRQTELSGREAYQLYGAGVSRESNCCRCRRRPSGKHSPYTAPPAWPVSSTSKRCRHRSRPER